MFQVDQRPPASRKQWVPQLVVLPRCTRLLSLCLPCCPWRPPQPNHAVCPAAGRHTHRQTHNTLIEEKYLNVSLKSRLRLVPGSSHICFRELSFSAQQFHQLPPRPRKPFPPPTRPAPSVGLAVKSTVHFETLSIFSCWPLLLHPSLPFQDLTCFIFWPWTLQSKGHPTEEFDFCVFYSQSDSPLRGTLLCKQLK